MNIIGIMSGTSIDGVDFVKCKVGAGKFRYLASAYVKFPPLLKQRLQLAAQGKIKISELSHLHYELGAFYAKQLKKIKKQKRWSIQAIGLHGQTVFHSSGSASLQIGEASYLQQELGVPVVSDFRSADIVAGGEGAPLAGIFHQYLAKQNRLKDVSFHNLGGISNFTYIKGKEIVSFDTGPANILMDIFCQKYLKKAYDKNASLAKGGLENAKLIQQMMTHPYFKEKPPKTCGREEFGEEFFKKYEKRLRLLGHKDALATLCNFSAFSIAESYRSLKSLPKQIILCGGGAKNPYLVNRIAYYLPEVEVYTSSVIKWNPSCIEGGAFAYLAMLNLQNKAIDLSLFTGAKKKVILGKLTK